MSDHDALLAAICDQPDEDTPRLALADWLDENGQPERAAFVRAQVELARADPWEPFAVRCRWRDRDTATGRAFRHTLPPVDGFHVEWHPEAFRRGLGWRLNVRSLVAWERTERSVLGRAPVGAAHLWGAATLDDWRRFAASPVVRGLREVHLVASPIEPLRALRDAPAALGIRDVHFGRAGGAGMPFVIEDLLAAPLGRVVRGLHFHVGYEALDDLIDALRRAPPLERVSFANMGLTADHVKRLHDSGVLASAREVDLRHNRLGAEGLRAALEALPASVRSLSLAFTRTAGRGFDAFNVFDALRSLRRLDYGGNALAPRMARTLARSPRLAGLRSLDLSESQLGVEGLRWVTRARFWPNLVELDLRKNPLPAAGVRHLLDAPVPADLTALVLTGDRLGADERRDLERKYGERVVFVPGEGAGVEVVRW